MELRFPYRRFDRRGRIVYKPCIPVYLSYRQKGIWVWPVVDSGAETTVFSSDLGVELGIDVPSGERRTIKGIGGRGVAFYHPVALLLTNDAGSVRYTTHVGFTHMLRGLGASGLLGQTGFFDKFVVTFDRPGLVITVRTRSAKSAGA